LTAQATIKGFVGGQGAGKSYIGSYDLLRRLRPGRLYMVLAPTYPMMRDATFRTFRSLAERLGKLRDWHKVEFIVEIATDYGGSAEVLFRSADDPDRLRGPTLSGLWMDEASLCVEEAFLISLARLREAGEMGWLTATFTPKGKTHWTYNTFAKGVDGSFLVRARTADNPFLHPQFITMIHARYSGLRAMQELEGEFLDIEGAEFDPHWFGPSIWFEDWPGDICLRWMALDPSKGKNAKYGDYSAFVMLAIDSVGHCWVDCDMDRRPTPRMVEDGLELARKFGRLDGFAIEANQFQELLVADFDRATENTGGVPFPIYPINNQVNKEVRIRRLGSYLSRGLIRFKGGSPGAELLVQQLREFPESDHDDGPDALEMAIRMAAEVQGVDHESRLEYAR
jgi:predicted phage terminase large subunit-like protein